nr:lipid-A-disaccharide synthase [Bacteroides sp.]
MNYFISAGEASGDLHASQLIAALRADDPQARFTFLGGDLMAREAGGSPLVHYRDMAYMGFSEVARHLSDIRANFAKARAALAAGGFDAVILVDYPGFNLRLAREAHRLGLPVYYFIAPKVWAWKSWRVKSLKRYCKRVFSIFPFEPAWFAARGMQVDYVGNPSVAETDARLAAMPSRMELIAEHDLTSRPILALVPGSRLGEIRANLPVMQSVARKRRDMQAVVAGAPGVPMEFYRRFTTLPVVFGSTFELMAHADAALVTSGTATLECALAGTPQVVCYRSNGSALTYGVMKRVLHVNHVSLPNLIMDATIIPEMLLHHCNPGDVADELARILPGTPGHEEQKRGYAEMRRRLGSSSAAAGAAALILQDLAK